MVHNVARTRGRPRSFDENAALKKAIQVFWLKGYDGVTIDDLVAGMGVGAAEPVCHFRGQADALLTRSQGLRRSERHPRCKGTPLPARSSRIARWLSEAKRGKCNRGGVRPRLSSHVHCATRGRC